MVNRYRPAFLTCLCVALSASLVAQRPAVVIQQEREQAAREVPLLADVLALKPGMTVADVGSGGGAMSVVLAKWLGTNGRVFATDVRAAQLAEIRDAVKEAGLSNVVVLEGAEASTNLPSACCDAIFLRDVYHHLTRPQEFDASLLASLKPGGRLAIMDFPPDPGSKVPDGVPPDRGGHGISASMIESEMTKAGLKHVKTLPRWPPDATQGALYLVLFEKP